MPPRPSDTEQTPSPARQPIASKPARDRSLLPDASGHEALLAVARDLRTRLHTDTALVLSLTIAPSGLVEDCRFVRAPGPPDVTSSITEDEKAALCKAARKLSFPAQDHEYQYGLTLGSPHLQ